MASLFEKKIGELKGVGEKRAKLFEKVGAPTVGALTRVLTRIGAIRPRLRVRR